MLHVWKIRCGSSLSDQHPASLPKAAARGLVSTSMRSRQELRKTYCEFESHSLRQRPRLEHSPPITAWPRAVGMVVFCERTSGLGMLVRSRKRSLFALFSPKLWTVLNQYGAGKPCVTDLYELLVGIEFENLSLGRKLRCESLSGEYPMTDYGACRNVGAAAGARNGMIQSRRGYAVHDMDKRNGFTYLLRDADERFEPRLSALPTVSRHHGGLLTLAV
jgi:hypothetical protein